MHGTAQRLTTAVGIAILVILAGCSTPTLLDGHYWCDPSVSGSCPAGWYCVLYDGVSDYRCFRDPLIECGNDRCEPGEDTGTCPADCSSNPVCGDGTCNGAENYITCAIDCTADPVCGDGICNGTENYVICPEDCAVSAVCGDGTCNGTETTATCPDDCTVACSDPVCDLYPQCGCTGGQKCSLDSNTDNECVAAGTTQAGGTCTAEPDCAVGTMCLGRDNAGTVGQCLAYCDPVTQAGCTGTTSYCIELVDSGSVPIPGAGICSFTCQPHNPSSGCPANFSCEVYTLSGPDLTFTDCHADVGTGTFGSTCDKSSGPYCSVGYGCFVDGTSSSCYQWCTSTSSCDATGTCDTTVFSDPIILSGTPYGLCL